MWARRCSFTGRLWRKGQGVDEGYIEIATVHEGNCIYAHVRRIYEQAIEQVRFEKAIFNP